MVVCWWGWRRVEERRGRLRRLRHQVGGVVVVLGYGVFDFGVVGRRGGGLLDWCWLLQAEVSCEEGSEFVLSLVGVCHFDGIW